MWRVYGLHLREALAGRAGVTLPELGDLAAELPRGSQVWRHLGGSQAISDEAEMLMAVEFQLRVQDWHAGDSQGKAPEMLPYPKSVEEREADLEKVTSRAERWAARHQKQE